MSASRRLFPELNQLLRMMEEPFFDSFTRRSLFPSLQQHISNPLIDMKETKDAYIVEAELAGVGKDDIHIECMDDHTLVLQGVYGNRRQKGTSAGSGKATATATPTPTPTPGPKKSKEYEDVVKGEPGKEELANQKDDVNLNTSESSTGDIEVSPDLSRVWQAERWYGEFQRSISFPSPIQCDKINASFKDGLLSLTVPKTEKKGIQIKISS